MSKKFLRTIIYGMLISILLASCVGNKKIVYFQENQTQISDSSVIEYQRNRYKLQINDILDIRITSLDENANKIFNLNQAALMNQMGIQGGGDVYFMTGYTINDSGMITLPIVGNVKLTGLNLIEAKEKLTQDLKKFFTNFHLQIRLGGLRYSTLGEFKSPGKYVVLQNQLTIFEAIANAHDLTEMANRNSITLVRQYPEGSKIHRINLLDKNIINSPYYFIQPNDLIYAEPLKRRVFGFGTTGLQSVLAITSVATSILLLINIINQTSK
jgi:polysaccharide export outer membrane protein